MLIPHNRFVNVALGLLMLVVAAQAHAQPDLKGWAGIVRSMQHASWVQDLEQLEPGSVLGPSEPRIDPERFKSRSEWAEVLVQQLENLPHGAHHADRALERLLADSMLCFRIMETAADRYRPTASSAFVDAGLPVEWALLPMALTGWDNTYYGPGRRAGAWAMDVPTALSHGVAIRRGWDERHIPEVMIPAAIAEAQRVTGLFTEDPLKQVIAFVQGPHAARRFNPEALDASLLEWCHLLRVILQVDRNFDRDDTQALWLMRQRSLGSAKCEGPQSHWHFSAVEGTAEQVAALKEANPWFTTDSIGFTSLRPGLVLTDATRSLFPSQGMPCATAPVPTMEQPVMLHTVQAGEVLGIIARNYRVRIDAIKAHNGLLSDLIEVGQVLEIPGGMLPPERTSAPQPVQPAPEGPWIWHVVQEGESYWSIAQLYPQADLEVLMRMNTASPSALRPGMKLRIPPP